MGRKRNIPADKPLKTSIFVLPEIRREIEEISDRTGLTMAAVIGLVVRDYLPALRERLIPEQR